MKKFLSLMEERGAVLLDTEIVLGHPELGYTGQPDKVWLMMDKEKKNIGIVISDWKTNKKKNMEINDFTKPMRFCSGVALAACLPVYISKAF